MYYLARFIRWLLLKLPLPAVYGVGKMLGWVFYANRRRRRTAFKNLKTAFPEKSSEEVLAIIKRSFGNFALSIVESLIFPRIPDAVKIEGADKIGPEGGILVAVHAGSWEINNFAFARQRKFAAFFQTQADKVLGRFFRELRQEAGLRICFSLKELVKCLNENYIVGATVDHGGKDETFLVEFFSHLVPTPKAAVYLAKKFNKPIFPCYPHRLQGFSNLAVIGGPVEVSGRADSDILQEINRGYEDYLREFPWEYFWTYKRFKRKLDRDVVILSDAKPGHLKQSKALLAFLEAEKHPIRSRIVEVSYKHRWGRIVADIIALFAAKHDLGCGRWLKFLTDKETWLELDRITADIVISAGSSLASLNRLLATYLGAKAAVVLRPNIPLKQFDLAVIPEHDRINSPEAVIIKGALISAPDLGTRMKSCPDYFHLGTEKKIAFFLGGPLGGLREFMENLKRFTPNLKAFAVQKGYKILVSTSRRTPRKAEDYLEQELSNFEQTEALIIANRKNYDFVFERFGASAEIIFVSSESISMVSEAASLKKPCVCVFLEDVDDKRKIFLESLREEVNFLKNPYRITSTGFKISTILEKNRQVLKKAVGRLL